MFPTITIFGLAIPGYGLFLLLGLILCFLWGIFSAKRFGVGKLDFFLLGLCAMAFGLLGAKILYLLVTLPDVLDALKNQQISLKNLFEQGGYIYWGGFLAGAAGALFFLRVNRISPAPALNLAAMCIPLGQAFGRLGCFAAGCCYGKPCDFGVRFHHSLIAPNDITLFPTQLVEAGFHLFLFALLWGLSFSPSGRKRIAYVYCYGYALFRFGIEFFRGDAYRGFFLSLSTSQWIALSLILSCSIFQFIRFKRHGSTT